MANDTDSGAEQASAPSTTYRAPVIEDEALIRLDIVETLGEAGFEIVGQAGDGEKTIELAAESDPGLVVMGVRMPGMDGIIAAEKILVAKRCAVVMFTMFSQSKLVKRARGAGAVAYVIKPFAPADLIPAVEIVLPHSQEIPAPENEVSNLVEQLETYKRVDRVKDLLETKMGLPESEAFRWIQKTSVDRRLAMREITDAAVEQVSGRNWHPSPPDEH